MNMKKYCLFFAFIFSLSIWGCSDSFIESESMTQKSSDNYYKTQEHAWETLVGCYNRLSAGGYGNLFQAVNVSSDETFGGGGKNDDFGSQIWDHFEIYSSDLERNTYSWGGSNGGRYFITIRRCAVLIEILDDIDWGSNTALRIRYEAEARFIRAHFAFELASVYGSFPLNKTSNEKNLGQTDPHEIYRFIVEDLQYAINNLPNQTFSQAPQSEFGRATKWAAMALLARVYLFYTGYFADSRVAAYFGNVQDIGISKAEVLGYLESVINDSGHGLVPRYGSLWPFSSRLDYHKDPTLTYAGEYNPEIIWSIRFSTGIRNPNPQYMGLRGVPFAGAYNPFWTGYGMCTINPKTADQYEEGDERRFASIIDVKKEFPDPYIQERLAVDQRDYTGYFQKKFQLLTSAQDSTRGDPLDQGATSATASYQDQPVIRYADVLLMAAELGSPNALNYVNQIRDRAFNDQNHRVSNVDIDVIYAERSREFVCEQLRYTDLLRRGLDYTKKEIDCNYPREIVQNTMTDNGKVIIFPIETLGLFRIPESQILVSEDQLIQNPGW